jgi:hypothetical protein
LWEICTQVVKMYFLGSAWNENLLMNIANVQRCWLGKKKTQKRTHAKQKDVTHHRTVGQALWQICSLIPFFLVFLFHLTPLFVLFFVFCDRKVAGNVMYFYFKTTKERKRGSFSLCSSLDLLEVFVYFSSSPVF